MLELTIVSTLTLSVLIGAPFLAHFVGWLASRFLRVRPGGIRDWMPSIPDHIEKDGRAEARWEKRRKAVEAKLLRKFSGGVQGAEALTLAADLGEDPEVVAGALGHMREEISTRLRVTRGGKLLHDFSADDIASLRRRRRMALPVRLGIFSLGVLANLGAAWPVVMGLLVAGGALTAIAVEGSAIAIGGTALAIVAALFVANMVAGWLTHLLLTPGLGLTNRPRLGPTKGAEESFAQMQEQQSAGWAFWDSGGGGGSSSSSSGGGCDVDGDLGEGIVAVVIIALLVAVVAACTFALGVFLRGIWRAATGAGMPPLDVSPAQWVRSTQPNDSWERFIPTNDFVLRVMRVLRRLVSHTHPRDSTIIGRIMAKARSQNGRIAALEIALQEGLDLDEATAVGARLSGRANGSIDVTDDGEIDFVFPRDSWSASPPQWDEDMYAEYLDYHPKSGKLDKRSNQEADKLPVNLPGISWSHVQSGSRLAAGTALMMMTGVAVVSLVPGMPLAVKIAVDSFLPLLALGTFALAGTLRYVASTLAEHGVQRDMRRMAFLHIRRAMARGETSVNFDSIVDQSRQALKGAWKGLDRAVLVKEVTAVAVDLDLEPLAGGGMQFSVSEVGARLEGLRRHRELASSVEFEFDEETADEVVFDSHIEHDRVRALA